MNREERLKQAKAVYNRWEPAAWRAPAINKASEVRHRELHDEIEEQTQEYLDNGGTITICPPASTGYYNHRG